MAMARSLAPLLLLSALVATAAAARTVGDSVQDACSKSQFPKICADSLSAMPESQKATPRRLAELFVSIAADKGTSLGTFLMGKFNSGEDTMLKCYDSCGDDVEEAMAHLTGVIREPTDAKFLELKSWLSSTLGGTSTCEDACKDLPKNSDKDEVIKNSLEFEKLLRVTLDLITGASGSMSADIALPPSDAGAPAAAPSSVSGSSAEAPASEGPASPASPQYGSAVSGPSAADSPASGGADAPAPSSGASSAPGPSGSSADAPSGDSSDAPGPSSDADDDDGSDDDDDTKA